MALARVATSAVGVSFRGGVRGVRSGVSRAAVVSAGTQTAANAAIDLRSELTIGETREESDQEWMEKFIRGREESSRLLIADGYTTDEAVMEMVAEEIRAYRREQAELEALDKK